MALPHTLNREFTATPWPGIRTPVARTDTIVWLGDSLIADGSLSAGYPIQSCYQVMVNAMCGAGTKPTFVNSGVGGNKIGDVVGNENSRVITHNPTILVSNLGINDVSVGTSAATFRSRYDSVLDTCLAALPSLKIVLVSPIIWGGVHPEGSNTSPYGSVQDPRISGYRDEVSDIATDRGLTFVDFRTLYFAEPQQSVVYWIEPIAQALHPSPIGQCWTSTTLMRAMPFVP